MTPEARRQAIIDAVAPVVLQRGPDLSTREIADAAGVAEGTLFRVFADKRELLLATCWHAMRPEAATGWLGDHDPGLSLEETLRQVVATMCDGVERMSRVLLAVRALRPAHGDPGHHAAHRPPPDFFEESNRRVIGGIADRLRPYGDQLSVSPERAALMVHALVLGFSHPGIGIGDRPAAEEITHLLLSGLGRSGGVDGSRTC
jgi:AcrR family transcriptional regulator